MVGAEVCRGWREGEEEGRISEREEGRVEEGEERVEEGRREEGRRLEAGLRVEEEEGRKEGEEGEEG